MKKISTFFLVVLISSLTCFPQEDIQEGIKDARTLSASAAELSDNINKLKKVAKEDQDAQDADAVLSPFVWRLNIVLDFYDLWMGMKNNRDRDTVYATFGNVVFECVSSYYTTNYNFNYLIIESENEQLISISNKIEKTMTDINQVLTPYEDEYAKTDKEVMEAITARDNNLKASSLEAEGVYKYSRKAYKDAVSLLEEAIQLRPTYGSAHYYLALSHINLERRQTAINLLNTYLDRMTPLVETASEQDVYYLSKCIELLEEIKNEKFK